MKNIILIFGLTVLATVSTNAQLEPCSIEQLAGTSSLFSLTLGNETLSAGDSTNVLFERPSESPVRRIRANVTIIDTATFYSILPANVDGLPVVFLANESNLDLSGQFGVVLPGNLSDGDYVFRVTLRSQGSLCYLDTSNFTVKSDIIPPVDCTPGSMRCVADLSGFQQCVETDADATSFTYGETIACAATTGCVELGDGVISCSLLSLIDECVSGASECYTPTLSRVCVLDPTTNTTVWGQPIECENGCDAETGLCDVPTNECTLESTECVDSDTSRQCVLNSAINTTVWSAPVDCQEGFLCNDISGKCEMQPVDKCTPNDVECVTPSSNRICLINPATNTTFWSEPAECPAGTSCSESSSLCTSGVPNSSCVPRSQSCISETEFDECLQNEDGFWNLGGVTTNCPDGFVCTPYINNTINCVVNSTTLARRSKKIYKRAKFLGF